MSRPTDLQLRSPKEISNSIYKPAVTYEGKSLAYAKRCFPGIPKVFLVSEERFRFTKNLAKQ